MSGRGGGGQERGYLEDVEGLIGGLEVRVIPDVINVFLPWVIPDVINVFLPS